MTDNIERENFIRVYNNAVSDEFCEEVIAAWNKFQSLEDLEEGHDWSDNSFRRDKAVFMDVEIDGLSKADRLLQENHCTVFFNAVGKCMDSYLKEIGIWNEMLLQPRNMKVQKYDHKRSGGYYAFHYEQSGQDSSYSDRVLTYLLYLNDVPEGEGETEFMYQGVRNQPKRGDMVVFPAHFTHTHRGNPVYTTDKYIATGWMLWAAKPEDGDQK